MENNYFEWLEKEEFIIEELNLEEEDRYVIYYEDIELITYTDEYKYINVNEVLAKKYLGKSLSKEKEIKRYLKAFKKEIIEEIKKENEEEKVRNSGEAKEERIIYSDSGVVTREIMQPMGFKTLMEAVDNRMYIIPKNQRNYIWTKKQVEDLAVSLIKGYPIPPLYCYRNDENQLVILDGQQRLISLYLYYKDKFLKTTSKTPIDLRTILSYGKEALLDKLDFEYGVREENYYFNSLNKKPLLINYSSLDDVLKRVVDFRPIQIIEIMVTGTEDKEEVFYDIFGRLNSGGTQLKGQELRNGIYQCDLYDMLHEINNTNAHWREIYGKKHRHYRDVELLLRCVATEYEFKFKHGEFELDGVFENSYPILLNNFSKKAIYLSKEEVYKYRKKLEYFIEKIKVINKIPNLLLESLYIAVTYIEGEYIISEELVKSIQNSKGYKDCIGSSSSSKLKVKKRLEFVYKKLLEYSRR